MGRRHWSLAADGVTVVSSSIAGLDKEMAEVRVRGTTVCLFAAVLLAGCAAGNAHQRATASGSPTVIASAVPVPSLTPQPSASPSPAPATPEPSVRLARTIYLTFDDGPNPTWTPEILALLEKNGVHASFFVIGENAKDWPGLVEREARDGDTVGDHTWSHPELPALTASAVWVQLARAKNLLTTLTGKAPSLWRPPYEAFNPTVIKVASGLGMTMQLWSVSTGDWELPGTKVIVSRVMSVLRNGMVVLFHDGGGNRSETVAALAILLTDLHAAGYRVAALPAQGIGW